jgi:hypothetical protein
MAVFVPLSLGFGAPSASSMNSVAGEANRPTNLRISFLRA